MSKAKAAGNYINSILAKVEAKDDGYDEAVMLDTNGFVSEATGENIFIVRDGVIKTTPWTSILGGLTRDSVMILGGLIAPLERMDSDSLDMDRLVKRLAEGEIQELILALGATLEAENTASFIRQMVRRQFPSVRVSRLAQGIPLGAEVKYMDKETLRQSLQFRQDLA
jgi:Recombinational DNA repair protein (RecF pathway)